MPKLGLFLASDIDDDLSVCVLKIKLKEGMVYSCIHLKCHSKASALTLN
jgi:hypothetical protein